MAQAPDVSLVDKATAALARHEWRAAFDALSAADAQGTLTPAQLELLAQAAWWTGQLPVAIEARERAYAAAVKANDLGGAISAAISLARDNQLRLSLPVARGWLKRAESMLEGVPESPGHGWLAAGSAAMAALNGDEDECYLQASRAHDIGKRLGMRDLETFGLSAMGAALVAKGQVDEGMALAEEATAVAVTGELDPMAAGGVCCATIETAAGIGDWRRAADWTEAQDRWCKREGINGYPGMCRIFRSEIKGMRGAWPEAEAEARLASDELLGFVPGAAGLALYVVGEIRLRRGDLPAAEEALLSAHGYGEDSEPALSLLRLAQGKVQPAAASIRRALTEPGMPSWRGHRNSQIRRLTLLPAQVEIALAAGDVATARAAADELTGLAETFGTLQVRANALTSRGTVELAEGDVGSAGQHLREAIRAWAELDSPYELARARMRLADVYLADDAADQAAIEVRAAHAIFERLGAALDLRQAQAAMANLGEGAAAPMGTTTTRLVRAFMFTDIVDSTQLAEAVGDEAWDKLIRRHDQVVRAAVAKQGGEEVKATGDGFFLAFADADQALEAAVAIQRALTAAREGDESVPAVRIGIHQAEANRVGLDYAGIGVNQASRIGDAAGRDEVLVSASTLVAAKHQYAESGRRTLELKGISAPVDVVSIDWH